MIELSKGGAYLVDGVDVIEESAAQQGALAARLGTDAPSKEEAAKNTIAYSILESHNTSGNMDKLKVKFDKMTSHDITFVGIIQTARASGLEKFPIPYVLTNCHNSLCAVGGTINEDDHMFGLTCAKKYGGIYVPPHQAVIHQFAREMLAGGGKMILGSDSHTRYGALGTMAMGEGGPELVKQLLNKTYDIAMPGVVGVYLTGSPMKGVGPQDIALAIIGEVFDKGYVKNKVMEFVGPGVANLSVDYRIGVDVMTTETTCLSSIWRTDDKVREFYEIHGRTEDFAELNPGQVAYYDGMIEIDLSQIKPMIAMPFHPSNTYTIEELNANLMDILDDCEKRAKVSLDGQVDFTLKVNGQKRKLYGAGCMDPTAPATLSRINYFIDKFKAAGFKYLKLDFLTAGMVEADKWYNKDITTGTQAFNYGMKYLRERCGDEMFIVESIAPLFPYQYANARRISCDAWGEMWHTNYMMNSLSFGWWLDRVYAYNDPDHLVMGDRSEAENMSRITSGAVTGYFMIGDNLSTKGNYIGTEVSQEKVKKFAVNDRINAVVNLGKTFRPAYGHKVFGSNRSVDLFTLETEDAYYIAYFNYDEGVKSGELTLQDLGITPEKVSGGIECWSGNNVQIQEGKLSYNLPKHQAEIYHLYKK